MSAPADNGARPPDDALARWAFECVASTDAARKLHPPPPPRAGSAGGEPLWLTAPGRPSTWRVVARHARTPSQEALREPRARARVALTFAHHEIQAGELMCWAILAFPRSPPEFRDGLARLALDEARHARLYVEQAQRLGLRLGDVPVRDWFWQRVPRAATPEAFVALLGLGFEAANLDHAERFAAAFERHGDSELAAVQREVGRDEREHVRFAVRWFRHFVGPLEFEAWRERLPPPLTPLVLRGRPLARLARVDSGMDADFVAALEAWSPDASGC